MADEKTADVNETHEKLRALAEESRGAAASFKRRVAAGEIATETAILGQMEDLWSLVADLAQVMVEAQGEQLEWADGIEDELEDLTQPPTGLAPDEAEKIKALFLALELQMKAPGDADYDAEKTQILKARVLAMLTFVDDLTIDEGDADDTDGDEDGDADDTDDTDTN